MTIEDKLKELIIREYKSLLNFAPYTGLPYSTIVGILKRGVLNSNAQNVFKICEVLGISADALRDNEIKEIGWKNNEDAAIEICPPTDASLDAMTQRVLSYAKIFGIDNKPLSPEETEFLSDSMDIIVEQIRKKREKDK